MTTVSSYQRGVESSDTRVVIDSTSDIANQSFKHTSNKESNIEYMLNMQQDVEEQSNALEQSLEYVNPFSRQSSSTGSRLNDKKQYVLMKEILSSGISNMHEMTLRELLVHISRAALLLDSQITDKSTKNVIGASGTRSDTPNRKSIYAYEDSMFGTVDSVCGDDNKKSAKVVNSTTNNDDDFIDQENRSSYSNIRNSSRVGTRFDTMTVTDGWRGGRSTGVGGGGSTVLGDESCAIARIRVRDLRRLDFLYNPVEENSVVVRRHAVLFCLDPIR
jgi:hypothetical protein